MRLGERLLVVMDQSRREQLAETPAGLCQPYAIER